MNSKKLSKKLDKVSDKICEVLSKDGSMVSYDQTRISITFERSGSNWGYGSTGTWKVSTGNGSESKEFTGKTINGALKSCLKYYKQEFQASIASESVQGHV